MGTVVEVLRVEGAVRCYNGCPDSALQRVLDEQTRIRDAIVARGYSVTYFPNGEFYQVFKNYLPVTGECKTLAEAERALPKEVV